MAKILTKEEKEQKKARDNLRLIHNRIESAWSFGQIKTYNDVHKYLGFRDTVEDKPISFKELKELFDKQTKELEESFKPKIVQEVIDKFGDWEVEARPLEEQRQVLLETVNKELEHEYGLEPSDRENISWYWFQKKALSQLCTKIFKENKSGVLLLAPTGSGKTPITYGLIRRAFDKNWHDGKTFSHVPYLVLTKAIIVEQHIRSAKKFFNLDPNISFDITNIETLRSKKGQLWVTEKVIIEDGKEKVKYTWRNRLQPRILLVDESQGAKNPTAKQSKIIYAYNDLPEETCLVCISATPFARVSEARAFAVSTHRPLEHLGFPKGTVLTNENWPAYSAIIAAPSKPDEYNEAAVARLTKDLDNWIVRVRGIRPQFNAINGVKIIPFESEEKRVFYESAYERFEKEAKKLEQLEEYGDNSISYCWLVIRLKFAMAAELCHADGFAKMMYEAVTERKKAAVTAIKFKQTLIEIVRQLIEVYGVSRDNISLIWGGGQTKLSEKQKAKKKLKEMEDKLRQAGISLEEMLAETGLNEVEDRVVLDLPPEYRLGPQTQEERQREIDKFQCGKSLYCIYTLKSGGVGLSLEHSDEFTEFKCRRKKSGYVFEEDIPKVPVRSRETIVTVTDNAFELAQAVGRVPRINSLSESEQNVYCYMNTVEVDMGKVYTKKFRCLTAVVKQHEDWQDIMFGVGNRAKLVEEAIAKTEHIADDENTLIDVEEGEDENENKENGEIT